MELLEISTKVISMSWLLSFYVRSIFGQKLLLKTGDFAVLLTVTPGFLEIGIHNIFSSTISGFYGFCNLAQNPTGIIVH